MKHAFTGYLTAVALVSYLIDRSHSWYSPLTLISEAGILELGDTKPAPENNRKIYALGTYNAGVVRAPVGELWEHAYDVYDRMGKEVEPESTTDENRELMQSYLLRKH